VAENRQIDGVSACFCNSQSKKHRTVNSNVFGGLEAQNHGIYDVFLPLVAKSTVFTAFFWPAPSKNTGIYGGFTM